MFGDDPSNARIAITVDSKNYDFDACKKDIVVWLRARIKEANMWILEFKRLRNIDMKKRGSTEISELETHDLFSNKGLLLQLHMVDCIYEATKRQLGEERIKQIQKKILKMCM